ncbi:hypothetical protein F2P56_014401 [Juglans regia]|uniref:Uncharacterized protein LOC108984128 n=2 Tax=Juglans regia TaxID=51240 RepID=A0A2I4DWI5_JUGRE|nr:uncharacterized protein LOC108984128 [Juglans regia]KAF5464317.1 hypothetical protein F2P56_014401 [Juglans regia]
MGFNSIRCFSSNSILSLFILFSCFFGLCYMYDELGYNSFTLSSFSYPRTTLRPFDLRYIRVDLPPWFSSMSIAVNSDVELDAVSLKKAPESALPVICFRDGSPPLPDVSNIFLNDSVLFPLSNGSFGGIQALQNVEQCFTMQKNITMKLTNEQISPGAWYFGLFNGIGPTRTQSKMIVRGSAYSFSANITVEGCTTTTMWGQYCNQTVDQLSCILLDSYFPAGVFSGVKSYNQTNENMFSCKNSLETSCLGDGEPKVYLLDVVGVAEELTIMAADIKYNVSAANNNGNISGINLMCFARHGAIPSATVHDYSSNISEAPLSISLPKVGRWYITILPVNISNILGGTQNTAMKVCYSMESQVLQCPIGKAGSNCTWERYALQTVLRRDSNPFESYYLPVSEKLSSNSANFPLEPLVSNSSYGGKPDDSWTYFILDIPRGAAGGNIHIRLTSDARIDYEVYTRFGGLPSLNNWDYYYANTTRSSDSSMFFKLYNSSKEKVDFYILYAREGTWGFGLRYLNTSGSASKDQTIMSVSLERCPKRCSSHGDCRVAFDASGLTSYSFCSCDRRHGGFDCSVEIVSHQGHIWQSFCLIASNAAAVLPAFWALRRKALAEWVVFTCSGIASGLYHACDVGTWCALTYNVLQFMDFWLSFMAVVSTFVYLATIDEVFKRAIHTAVAILTALMAATKATRSSNIVLVVAIGALGLLIGWLIEISTTYWPFSLSIGCSLNMPERWQNIKGWFQNLIHKFFRRFRWGFMLAGFTSLAMAAISWKLETSESYWIWHSVWHVTIYTSSFFFLCSKAKTLNNENQIRTDGNYELTRQDSFSRGESVA